MSALGYFRLGYNNRVPTANITTSGDAVGFDVANVADQNRNTFYKPDATSATHWIKFDTLTSAYSLNFLALLGHNFKACGVTHVYLKYGSTDNGSTWDTYAVNDWDPTAEASDFDIFFYWTGVFRRYWLLVFDVAGTAPLLGEVFLGNVMEFTNSWGISRSIDHGVDVQDSGSGYSSAEQYGAQREIIGFGAADVSDAQIVLMQAAEAALKNGLNPCVLLDIDTESAKGLAKYGRLLGPLTWTQNFLDNNAFERTWRQEL